MATTSISRRVVRLPYNPNVPAYSQVRQELMAKMNSLKLTGTNVMHTVSDTFNSLVEGQVEQFECSLSSANDTTLVSSFAAWESLLYATGSSQAGTILDTEVYVTITSGH